MVFNVQIRKKEAIQYIILAFVFIFCFFYPNTSPEVLLICNTSISNTILREYNSSNKLIVLYNRINTFVNLKLNLQLI